MLNKNILVPVADGVEELECVTIVDVLRRAGIEVRLSSIASREITGAHNIKIIADSDFSDEAIEDYDGIVLPGGMKCAESFFDNTSIIEALENFSHNNELIGAICASPALVLARAGFLDNKKATCYPALKDNIRYYSPDLVVVDQNIITSQGPGTAMLFALALVENLGGAKIALETRKALLF